MDAKAQAAVAELIRVMEKREQQVREAMIKKYGGSPRDRFMPGWAHGIHLSWEHNEPEVNIDYEGCNEITCFFEFNGIHVSGAYGMDEDTNVDLTFLTKDIFENDIVPALREWAQSKVDAEPYGGLYGSSFRIIITLSTNREVRADDPPHKTSRSRTWEQEDITVTDEKRLEVCREMARAFIANKEYMTENIREIDSSLSNLCTYAVEGFPEEFDHETILAAFSALLEQAKKAEYSITMTRLMYAFSSAAAALLDRTEAYFEQECALACELCILILQNGTDKYEKDAGRHYLGEAAALGYAKAKDIMKYGTGQIPKEISAYKDELVTCSANDIDKVVDIKIKEETAAVYTAVIQYLTRLIKGGFPGEYSIKFNSKVKNYIPTDLKKSKMNNFFANAAQYPACYAPLREYYRVAFDDYNYYSDADNEAAVTCGGYAAMALAFADPEANFDIGMDFLEHSDFEHAITSRYFAQDFADVLKGDNQKKVKKYMKEWM